MKSYGIFIIHVSHLVAYLTITICKISLNYLSPRDVYCGNLVIFKTPSHIMVQYSKHMIM